MKAYIIIDEDADQDENATLVFANNEDEARRIGWSTFDREATLAITRAPQVDSMVKLEATKPYECCNDEICVAAGLRPDGWSYCCDCGELTNRCDEFDYVCADCALDDTAPEDGAGAPR